MSEQTISPLLAAGAMATVVVALALVVGVELKNATALRRFVSDRGQILALVVAGSAMAASLYYSEIAGFLPCEFCWYQRIAMYPLAVLLGVAVVTRRYIDIRFTAVIAVIGLALSVYHYQLQLFPDQGSACVGGVACTAKYVEAFGFATIPFMAGAAFLSVILVRLAEWRSDMLMDFHGE